MNILIMVILTLLTIAAAWFSSKKLIKTIVSNGKQTLTIALILTVAVVVAGIVLRVLGITYGLFLLPLVVIFYITFYMRLKTLFTHINRLLKKRTKGEIEEIKDLSFCDHEDTGYDLYLPENKSKSRYSLFLYLHGGGYTSGERKEGVDWCRYMASKGYVAATMDYSLHNEKHSANINMMYEEMQLCVAHIVSYCREKGIVVNEMTLSGVSAGGGLALLYAYKNAKAEIPVRFVFEMTGPASFVPSLWYNTDQESSAQFITMMTGIEVKAEDVDTKEVQSMVDNISPYACVTQAGPPTICAYGPNDHIVPVALKFELFKKLDEYKIPYDYLEYAHSNHGMYDDSKMDLEYINLVDQYCQRYFTNK